MAPVTRAQKRAERDGDESALPPNYKSFRSGYFENMKRWTPANPYAKMYREKNGYKLCKTDRDINTVNKYLRDQLMGLSDEELDLKLTDYAQRTLHELIWTIMPANVNLMTVARSTIWLCFTTGDGFCPAVYIHCALAQQNYESDTLLKLYKKIRDFYFSYAFETMNFEEIFRIPMKIEPVINDPNLFLICRTNLQGDIPECPASP